MYLRGKEGKESESLWALGVVLAAPPRKHFPVFYSLAFRDFLFFTPAWVLWSRSSSRDFSVAHVDMKWWKVLFLDNFTWVRTQEKLSRKRTFHHFRIIFPSPCDTGCVHLHCALLSLPVEGYVGPHPRDPPWDDPPWDLPALPLHFQNLYMFIHPP